MKRHNRCRPVRSDPLRSSVDRSAARITDIVGVIDSIAFQSNILALDAFVEAGRLVDSVSVFRLAEESSTGTETSQPVKGAAAMRMA
jgi:hypothetical protein